MQLERAKVEVADGLLQQLNGNTQAFSGALPQKEMKSRVLNKRFSGLWDQSTRSCS